MTAGRDREDLVETEPEPEMRARPESEAAVVEADRVDPETGFGVFRGRCRREGSDVVLDQSVTRHVHHAGIWLLAVAVVPYAASLVLTRGPGDSLVTPLVVLAAGWLLPAMRVGAVIAARLRGYTGETRIPVASIESVTVAFERRTRQLRRGRPVTVPIFELRYREEGRAKRRRIRVPIGGRGRAAARGVAFFERVGVEPNADSFWIREGLCRVADGRLTFERTVDVLVGRRGGAVLAVVSGGLLLTGVLGIVDWGEWLLLATVEVPWLPVVGGERVTDAIVVVVALLGLLFGAGGLLESRPFDRAEIPVDAIRRATIDESSDGPALELVYDLDGEERTQRVSLPERETVGDLDVTAKARSVLEAAGVETEWPAVAARL